MSLYIFANFYFTDLDGIIIHFWLLVEQIIPKKNIKINVEIINYFCDQIKFLNF